MNLVIRNAQTSDIDAALTINQANLPAVSSLRRAELEQLAMWSNYFKVAVNEDERVMGFLLCLGPGKPYQSLNYTWFAKRYDRFLYIDRIAIDTKAQRQGLGRRFYADAQALTKAEGMPLLCEVNIVPRNDDSLAFHERLGFRSVGEQDTEGGKKRVTLLCLAPS